MPNAVIQKEGEWLEGERRSNEAEDKCDEAIEAMSDM